MAKALAIVAAGVILQLSAVWFLGESRDGGLFFCCRGVPDDIYHLALTNQLVSQFPPQEPGMVGAAVKNYHYLAALTMADFIRVFHLPLMGTVYQYFPLFVSVSLGLTIIASAQILQLSTRITHLWLFFLYFHGDILYLLTFLRGKGLNFDVTVFDDATKLLAGPPRSFSILLLFTGLAFCVIWLKQKKFLAAVLAAVIFGSLLGFKVYTGIFALVGLTFAARKKLVILLPAFLIGLAVYLPVNGTAGGFSWNGFYRFDNFVSQPAFGLGNLELARLAGAWYLLPMFAGLYFVFLYGSTLLAIFQSRKTLGLLPTGLNVFLLSATAVTAVLGLFFVQSIGGLNTVQFLISLYFVAALYAALAVSRFPWPVVLAVVLLTVSRPLYEAWGNVKMIRNKEGLVISYQELEALNYLKIQPRGIVALPRDFAKQEISFYVSFLANQPIYLAGYTGVLEDHQVPGARDRLENPDFSKIDYFYLPKKYSFSPPGQIIFENQEAKILKKARI